MEGFEIVKRGEFVGFGVALEEKLGFSRAIRVGDTVYTSGLTSTDKDGKVQGATMYEQLKICYEKMALILEAHGASLKHVVKETWYLSGDFDLDGAAKAHSQAFGDVRPVLTGIGSRLLDPEMLIEIDAVAVIR